MTFDQAATSGDRLVHRALRLAYFTVAWNAIEGGIAIWAAIDSGSDALLSFGLDSAVVSICALVLIRRLRVEQQDPARAEQVESRALRLIGVTYFILAAYVTYESIITLVNRQLLDTSSIGPFIGLLLTLLSMVGMKFLAHFKKEVGEGMDSIPVLASAAETRAVYQISRIVFIGLLLSMAFNLWWADPLAALGAVGFMVREGREAIRPKRRPRPGDLLDLP